MSLAVVGLTVACSQPPTNVVLITVDTLRADHVGAYGATQATPSMDSIAAEGVVFEDASTVLPRTTQAVASLLTGLLPIHHGSLNIGQSLQPEVLTLAEILSAAGYTTTAVSANPVAGPNQELDRGFEVFVDRSEIGHRHQLARPLTGPVPAGTGPAEAVSLEAIAAVEATAGQPYFLWALYMDPHWDYNPPAPANEVVDWQTYELQRSWRQGPKPQARLYFDLDGQASAGHHDSRALYAAEVAYTDHMIGRLLDHLRQREDWNRTLVIITSDHGESLGEGGYWYQHGALVHQPTLHIPLMLRLPGHITTGRRVTGPVSIIDVVPTVLGLLGIELPKDRTMDGLDLGPQLQSSDDVERATEQRIVLAESGSVAYPENPIRDLGGRGSERFLRSDPWVVVSDDAGLHLYDATADPLLLDDLKTTEPKVAQRLGAMLDDVLPGGDRWRAARMGPLKAVRIPEADGVRWQLFHLGNDPAESHDLVAEGQEVPDELVRALQLAAGEAAEHGREAALLDSEIEAQLRTLGYTGG